MSVDDFGREYLLLALRIGKLIDGYIDSYYGPEDLKNSVNAEEKSSPKELVIKCSKLQEMLAVQEFDSKRTNFIRRMLKSMETTLRVLSGEKIEYLEIVKQLFDISPILFDDNYLYRVVEECKEIFQITKPLKDTFEEFQKQRAIAPEKIEPYFLHAFKLVKTRTKEVFPNLLPSNEELSVEIVKEKPWAAYNWYLGNSKSRIDINTDQPLNYLSILKIASHEGYPGHHTEHSIKESILYRQQGRFEHAILIVQSPESVISEGLANVGLDLLFTPKEQIEISIREYCPDTTKERSIEDLLKINEVLGKFSLELLNNAAIHLHQDNWSDEELLDYAISFEIFSKEDVIMQSKFLKDPLWSTYVFNYLSGENLIRRKFGKLPSTEHFKKLLTQPILPSDLELENRI